MKDNKYIHILHIPDYSDNEGVGVISTNDLESNFKEAIAKHFDAELLSYTFGYINVDSLDDCISAVPITVHAEIRIQHDGNYGKERVLLELSEAFLTDHLVDEAWDQAEELNTSLRELTDEELIECRDALIERTNKIMNLLK